MASCEVDADCGYGWCTDGACFCSDIIVGGDRCQYHYYGTATLNVYLVIIIMLYTLLIWRLFGEYYYGKHVQTNLIAGTVRANTILFACIIHATGWLGFNAVRLFVGDEESARISKTVGLFSISPAVVVMTAVGSRIAWQFHYLRQTICGNLPDSWAWKVFRHLYLVTVVPLFFAKTYFLFPGPDQSQKAFIKLESISSIIGRLLFQIPVSVYGPYVMRVLKAFPQRHERKIQSIRIVSQYTAAVTVVSVTYSILNGILPRARPGEAPVAVILAHDAFRNVVSITYGYIIMCMIRRTSWSWRKMRVVDVDPSTQGKGSIDVGKNSLAQVHPTQPA